MLYTYKECIDLFGSKYNIKKMLAEGSLFKQEKGMYSDERYVPELAVISKKYPKAVITLDTAFYLHDLTDVIPQRYQLATNRGSSKISDSRVVQIFENTDNLMMGAERTAYKGTEILMYNKERMLVELLRNKNKLPFDYYKEILENYRRDVYDMDVQAIQDYIEVMPKKKMITEALQLEVF